MSAATPAVVAAWEDDPGDPNSLPPLVAVPLPAPNPAAPPLPFKIGGPVPPLQVYQVGTSNFRFYACATALRRTASFWGAIVPTGTRWRVGKTLPVVLDDGVDLNAFYTRGGFGDAPGLHFFHESVAGRAYFSAESPDVVCHEMGHALLDAIRPQLFNAQTIEAAAFHESFGDMSAMLSALQLASFRQVVLNETGGVMNRASRLSRLAEQLGAAIRVQHPDAVDRDCLRNASNAFFYRDPQTLPPSAPASQLSSEPHSFSRVFTGGFLDALTGVVKALSASPTADDLLKASQDLARILVAGVRVAPVVPEYYSQVAANLISAGEASPFSGKYRDALKSAFVRRGILSLSGAAGLTSAGMAGRARAVASSVAGGEAADLPMATISGEQFGLKQTTLRVHSAGAPKRFAVTSSSLTLGPLEPRSPQNAAESFTEDLFQRGRVDLGPHGHPDTGLAHPLPMKTHVVVATGGELVLKRRTFDCGFD